MEMLKFILKYVIIHNNDDRASLNRPEVPGIDHNVS
jgi:hypothetical protein